MGDKAISIVLSGPPHARLSEHARKASLNKSRFIANLVEEALDATGLCKSYQFKIKKKNQGEDDGKYED